MNLIFLAAVKLCHLAIDNLYQITQNEWCCRQGLLSWGLKKVAKHFSVNSKPYLLCVSIL